MQNHTFRPISETPGKCPDGDSSKKSTIIKNTRKWPFEYQISSTATKYGPKRKRRTKAADLFWERPKAATMFGRNRIHLMPERPCSSYFWWFLTFSRSSSSEHFPGVSEFGRKVCFFHQFHVFCWKQSKTVKHMFCVCVCVCISPILQSVPGLLTTS